MKKSLSSTLKVTIAMQAVAMMLAAATPALATQDTAPKAAAECANPDATGTCDTIEKAASNDAAGGAIVVTGSRIPHRQIDSASPVQVLDAKALEARGFQTVAQALNELPTFGIPGASPVGFNQSGFGAGQSFVNFLGLGSQRTLTLVNGRRFVSSNTGSIFGPTGNGGTQVDLNTIPTKLIERVETVAAIGAPIYGSDAIAGTINIILKKNFEGIDFDAQNGISLKGDAPDQRLRALIGKNFAGGRGNITISGEYDNSKGLLYTARDNTAPDNRFGLAASGSGPQPIYKDLRVPSVDPNGIPMVTDFLVTSAQQSNIFLGSPTSTVGVTNAAGQTLRFAPNGTLMPIDFGGVYGSTNGFQVFTTGGNGYSLSSVENLLTDLERYSVNANLNYQLTDHIRFFSEGWYSVSQGRNLANQPVYQSALFANAGQPDGNLIVKVSNPYLSAAARAAIQNAIATNPLADSPTQDYFYLARASTDLSSGVSTGRSEVIRFVGGFDGALNVLPGREWKFEAYLNYGRANVTSKNPELNEQNFLNAINAVTNASGAIVCAPGVTNSPIATVSSTCAPINPFGQQISQAAKDYVTTIATPQTINHQYDAIASVSGPLFKLPGGDFSFALGYEHRKEDSNFNPGAFYFGSGTGPSSQRGQYGRSVPIDPVVGSYFTNEVFGEINADLISPSNGIPFIYSLTLQSAGRYIWNSSFGNNPTYTFQARYAPVRDVAFRGAYTRAVRAPSITEAFNPTSSAFGFAIDVCDASLVNQGPAPATRTANCAAAGIPANYVSLSNQRSFPTFTFGNSALHNEKSNSYTAGIILTPTFIPGLNATVDYVKITINDAITAFTNSQVVQACYDAPNYPNNPFCSLITRDSVTKQLSNLGTTYFNSARLRYKGIIADVSYRRPTPMLGSNSSLALNISYQYLDTRTDEATIGAAPLQYDNSIGYSRNKGVATLSYSSPKLEAQVQANYIGPALIDPNKSANFYSVTRINAFTYVNMSVAYNVTPHFTFHVDVDNVFNAKAPYPYPAGNDLTNGTSTYFQGILGTYFRVGAGVHF
jgi:iron complex outermembrane receptor protein